jgi:hypothetical protein
MALMEARSTGSVPATLTNSSLDILIAGCLAGERATIKPPATVEDAGGGEESCRHGGVGIKQLFERRRVSVGRKEGKGQGEGEGGSQEEVA